MQRSNQSIKVKEINLGCDVKLIIYKDGSRVIDKNTCF